MTICVVWHDMALPLRKQKRDALPAPVVDVELHHAEGGGLAVGRNARLVAIFSILAADGVVEDLFGLHQADRSQHLHLFVADGVGLELGGGLHRRQRHQLQQVVLEHVAQNAHRIVVRGAVLDGQ